MLVVVLLSCASAPVLYGQGHTEIQIRGQEVRYTSGKVVYVEALAGGCWVGRSWTAEGHAEGPSKPWDDEAFGIRLKDTPTPQTIPGKSLSRGWEWVSASELPRTERGARHAVVELSNSIMPITLKVHTILDGTPVLTRWVEIRNDASKPVALTEVFPWSGRLWSGKAPIALGHSIRREVHFDMGGFEGSFGWTALRPGTNGIENDRGLTWEDPYFILRNDSRGEYFFGQLAWPVNYLMEFQKGDGLTFKIGPTSVNALRVIGPNETIATPAVHLGYVKGDFDDAVQAMHDHVRRSVLPARKPGRSYLIEYLFPEDQEFTVVRGHAYNEVSVRKAFDVAAAAGVELVIVDGPTWCSSYGNWLMPDPERFPHGLDPLRMYAHKKGLLFGLYAEPEGGRDAFCSIEGETCIGGWDESQVFRQHPDWFFQPMRGSILNLSIPEAAAYLEAEISRIIDHYLLDLYRHDFNGIERGQGSETVRGGFIENDYWRHYEAFYGISRRLREKYPNLILQQASSGGARSDLATVAHWQEHMSSDLAWHPDIYQMQSGFSVFLPPEIIVFPHGMAGPDQPDRTTMLRGAYCLGNTPMIFNGMLPKSLEEFKREDREGFLHYANLYKTFIRPMLATTRVYHHAPVNATGGVATGNWLAMEFTSPDRTKGWATIIRLSKTETGDYLFTPKGLASGKRYRITFDNSGETRAVEGDALMRDGVAVRPTPSVASELLLFEVL
jgi:alpha-galactosidase